MPMDETRVSTVLHVCATRGPFSSETHAAFEWLYLARGSLSAETILWLKLYRFQPFILYYEEHWAIHTRYDSFLQACFKSLNLYQRNIFQYKKMLLRSRTISACFLGLSRTRITRINSSMATVFEFDEIVRVDSDAYREMLLDIFTICLSIEENLLNLTSCTV